MKIEIIVRISDDFLFFKKFSSTPYLEIRCDQLLEDVVAATDERLKERRIGLNF